MAAQAKVMCWHVQLRTTAKGSWWRLPLAVCVGAKGTCLTATAPTWTATASSSPAPLALCVPAVPCACWLLPPAQRVKTTSVWPSGLDDDSALCTTVYSMCRAMPFHFD